MKLRLLLAAAVLAVFAVPAFAVEHQSSLSSSVTKFEWEGAAALTAGPPLYVEQVRTAIPCNTPGARPCEEVLLKVEEAGKFSITVEGLEGTGGTTDVDAYLFKSDESGAQGDPIASSAVTGPDTVSVAKAAPGFYLLQVDYYHAYESGYKGVAKFTPAAPVVAAPPAPIAPVTVAAAPAPAAAAQTTAAPAAKKAVSKRAACQKKARKAKSARKRKAALKRCAKLKK
jgi:hypothetical protein